MSISKPWRATAAITLLASSALTVTGAVGDTLSAPVGRPGGAAVSHADMVRWLADGERGLWIQTRNLKWFYGRFKANCSGLNATNSIVIDTGSSDKIKPMTIIAIPGRGRCAMRTFASSTGPPKDRNAGVEMQPQSQ